MNKPYSWWAFLCFTRNLKIPITVYSSLNLCKAINMIIWLSLVPTVQAHLCLTVRCKELAAASCPNHPKRKPIGTTKGVRENCHITQAQQVTVLKGDETVGLTEADIQQQVKHMTAWTAAAAGHQIHTCLLKKATAPQKKQNTAQITPSASLSVGFNSGVSAQLCKFFTLITKLVILFYRLMDKEKHLWSPSPRCVNLSNHLHIYIFQKSPWIIHWRWH